ncbi:MAG: hypothetical protein ABEJ73_01095 [Haloplanus sp.]
MDESDLEDELRSAGIDIHEVESVDPVELSYVTAHPGMDVNHTEMGRALNAFIDLAEENEWEPTRVEATVLRFEDDVMNTWYAEKDWFEGLLEYRLSETEFSTHVLETLEEDDDH